MCCILTADGDKSSMEVCAHGLCAHGSVSVTFLVRNLTLQDEHLCLYELSWFAVLMGPVDALSSASKDFYKAHVPSTKEMMRKCGTSISWLPGLLLLSVTGDSQLERGGV